MINTDKLCPNCMNEGLEKGICTLCGFDLTKKNPIEALPIKYILADRYIIGKILSRDSEGISYFGFDLKREAAVFIKEYFPKNVSARNPDKTVFSVKGYEYSFNEGLMEFLEINRTLMDMDPSSVAQVFSAFEENGTAYSVSEKLNGITLEEFLERNGNALKWEQARPLFLPLIDTLIALGNKRIYNLGVSPKTIIVSRDAKLRFEGISVSASHYLKGDIEPELYDGYSAPEQYKDTGFKVDAATDVYGLSAVLFRALIGSSPANATERILNDSMSIPARFAEELPRQVLVALANGLQVNPENRTPNMDAFKNELVYGETQENIRKAANARKAAIKAEISNELSSDSKTAAKVKRNAEKKAKPTSSAKYALISAGCTAGFFALLAIILCLTVFRSSIFKKEEGKKDRPTTSMPSVESVGDVEEGAEDKPAKLYSVPDFTGKYYAKIIEDEQYEDFKISLSGKAYSDTVARGTVCEQTVKAGSEVVKDTEIGLVISLGPKEIKIANTIGQTKDEALLELLKQGFLYENIIFEEKYDSTKKPAVVIDQIPAYGSSVNTDMAITVYINSYLGDEEEQTEEIIQ